MTRVLAIDVGKTRCRAGVWRGDHYAGHGLAAGAPGLAESGGLTATEFSIAESATQALENAAASSAVGPRVEAIGVGAAGAEAARPVAAELASKLGARYGAPTAVASDSLTAHAGAFRGQSGTVLIAGTGAVAVSIDANGELRQIDGWGPWLGDEGSGQWIGRMGLVAALRAHDRRGRATSLEASALELAGSAAALPAWVSGGGTPARQLGMFAPTVLHAAAMGDEVADGIVRQAVDLLADTCQAAANPDVCLHGGVSEDERFRSILTVELSARGMRVKNPLGDALAGAAFIAERTDTPYEGRIVRA